MSVLFFKRVAILTLAAVGLWVGGAAYGQTTDPGFTQPALLNGAYALRHVIYNAGADGSIARVRSTIGVLFFDGQGRYDYSGTVMDTASLTNAPSVLVMDGAYEAAPNGMVVMDNPQMKTAEVLGGVGAGGILTGSTASAGIHDLLVAIPISTTIPTNQALQGTYRLASLDVPKGQSGQIRSALLSATANGQGAFTSATAIGFGAGLGAGTVSQTPTGLTYDLSGGIPGSLTIPATDPQQLVSGTKDLFLSADGNTLLGGSESGFDILIGFKAAPSALLQGPYFTAGVESSPNLVASYYGSVTAAGNGMLFAHQSYGVSGVTGDQPNADLTTADSYTVGSDGNATEQSGNFLLALGSQGFLGIRANAYGLEVGVRVAGSTSAGVSVNPWGVVNTASSAPFTNPIAPGEFITIYGTNLAAAAQGAGAAPLPTTLGGVQVLIAGVPAPLSYVSPTQVNAVVPNILGSASRFATVSVVTNGAASNATTAYVSGIAPGVFMVDANGSAAALHANGALVTASNPAHPGETIEVFATGLGTVLPDVAPGVAASGSPLTTTTTPFSVSFNGAAAATSFEGLAPGFADLYQINVQVPAGAATGNLRLGVGVPGYAYTEQTTVAVGR